MKLDTATPHTPLAEATEPALACHVLNRRDDHFYEELSRINDELANLQRELARTKAEMAAAQKKLAISEKRYRSLSACSPIGIFELDSSGRCLYTNSHWQAISGLTAEESLGDGWQRVLDQRDAPAFLAERNLARQARRDFSCEVRFVNTRGNQRWAQVRSRAIPAEDGEAAGRVSTVEDVTERKMAESELRKFSRAIEQSPVSIVITDLQGAIEYVNPKFCALTGYSFEEVHGKNPRVLKSGEMPAEAYRQMWAKITAGQDWSGEFHNRKKNGGSYWESASISPIRDDTGKVTHLIAVKEDISERRWAEKALQGQLALRERLAKIAANVPGIIYSFRLQPDGATCLPYASPTIEEFFGVRGEDLVADASSLLNQIHPEDQSGVEASIAESARTMLPWRAEFRVRHPKKSVFWVEGQSTPEREADGSILWHGFMSDISGRKQAEETLRQIEFRLAHAMRLAQLVEWEYDVTNGLFTFSDRYYALHGTSIELEGGNLMSAEAFARKFMHPDDAHLVADEIAKCVATVDPNYVSRLECRILRRDGDLRHALVHIAIAKDSAGRTVQLRGANHDITERKQAQAEREKLECQVAEHKAKEESARLALEHEQKSSQIKSRFVSLVSHEFRTPLSIINMAAELLDGYLDKMTEEERTEHLNEIKSSVERMTQMMNDFLVHGNCASGKMECQPTRVEVESLCRRLIAEVPGCSGPARAIDCAIDPAVGEAWLDEKILRHILGNLLSNAIKYSSDGEPVKLEVKRAAGSPQPNGGHDPSLETHLQFKVTDTGIGIPAADMAKLYQTFHRASNVGNRPGTGMGLAIVKQFVELHQGTIRFESQEGKGTTVWVELPIGSPVLLAGS